jgi:hypothetical protein
MALDKKSKNQMIVIGVLVPVMIILFWVNLKPKNSGAPAAAPAAAAGPAPAVFAAPSGAAPSPELSQKREAELKTIESAEWGANPFLFAPVKKPVPEPVAPPPPRKAPIPTFALEGIVYDARTAPYAIIDGELCVTGDLVKTYRITKITSDTVTLEKDGQSVNLKLFPEVR